MNNYNLITNYLNHEYRDSEKKVIKVLDFGCGSGELVRLLLGDGYDAYGADVYYEGKYHKPQEDLFNRRVFKMAPNNIPFENEYFDVIITNMVFEHVENLSLVLSEIARVCNRGGMVISVFRLKNTWYEGHAGVYFLHWFKQGSKLQKKYYQLYNSLMGAKTKLERKEQINFLEKWTHYRSLSEVKVCFKKVNFENLKFIESFFFDFKVGSKWPFLTKILTRGVKRIIVQKMAFYAFSYTKRNF